MGQALEVDGFTLDGPEAVEATGGGADFLDGVLAVGAAGWGLLSGSSHGVHLRLHSISRMNRDSGNPWLRC